MTSAIAPVIVSFPREDRAFAAHVRLLLGDTATASSPPALELRLRTMYPGARVVMRVRLAGFDDQPVWYAYRDGRIAPAQPATWWTETGAAWHDIGVDGLWTDMNAAMEALVGLPREEVIGRTWERFGTPEAIASQGPIWDVIERDGVIDSLFRLRLEGGDALDVEYHMERLEPGRYRCWWRPVHIDDEIPGPGGAQSG